MLLHVARRFAPRRTRRVCCQTPEQCRGCPVGSRRPRSCLYHWDEDGSGAICRPEHVVGNAQLVRVELGHGAARSACGGRSGGSSGISSRGRGLDADGSRPAFGSPGGSGDCTRRRMLGWPLRVGSRRRAGRSRRGLGSRHDRAAAPDKRRQQLLVFAQARDGHADPCRIPIQ